jgi:mRNA interferase MazF
MNRGDVVLADFPFQDMSGSKLRPAIVVQNDSDNDVSANTVLVMVTGNLRDSNHPAAVYIDPFDRDGIGSGLRGPSLIKCGNLATLRKNRVLQVIGKLGDTAMQKVDDGLAAALGLA